MALNSMAYAVSIKFCPLIVMSLTNAPPPAVELESESVHRTPREAASVPSIELDR